MKKFILILFGLNCIAQAPSIEWQKCIGGSNSDSPYALAKTNDGGYAIAGYTFSNNGDVPGNHSTVEDVLVVKLNSDGIIQWSKNYGGYGDDEALGLVDSLDGGLVFAGYTMSNNGDVYGNHGVGNSDFWVVKLNNFGNIVWSKCLGGSGSDTAHDIIRTTDNGYIIIGQSNSNNFDVNVNHGLDDVWVVKLSSNGVIEWQKSYGGSNHDLGQRISSTSDGGYIFTGMTRSNDGDVVGGNVDSNNTYNWVVKIDNSGTIQWQKIINIGWGYKILELPNGEYIGLGSYLNLFKLNTYGDILWQAYLIGSGYNYSGDIMISDNNFIITGSTNVVVGNGLNNNGGFDALVVKTDSFGNILWGKNFGGTSSDSIKIIKQTSDDNGFICAGFSSSNDGDVSGLHGSSDFWVVKLTPEQLSTYSFQEDEIKIYPNPSSNLINIQIPSENNNIDSYKIFDFTGKQLTSQNNYANQINIESLSKGIYILQVYSGNKIYSSKFIKE